MECRNLAVNFLILLSYICLKRCVKESWFYKVSLKCSVIWSTSSVNLVFHSHKDCLWIPFLWQQLLTQLLILFIKPTLALVKSMSLISQFSSLPWRDHSNCIIFNHFCFKPFQANVPFTSDSLTFSGGIEREHWPEMG